MELLLCFNHFLTVKLNFSLKTPSLGFPLFWSIFRKFDSIVRVQDGVVPISGTPAKGCEKPVGVKCCAPSQKLFSDKIKC